MKKLFLFILIGSFSCKLVAASNSAACSVTITSNPTNGRICAGSCATLTATATGTPPFHYLWMPGGQTTDTITVCPSNQTTYTVTVIDSTNCTVSATGLIVLKLTPVFSYNQPSVCENSCVSMSQIFSTGSILYTWSPDSFLSSSTGPYPLCCPLHTITYTVTGNLNGCTNTDTVTVSVNPLPIITVSSGVTICRDSSTVLTAFGAGLNGTYAWSPSLGLTSTSSDTTSASPLQTQTYFVTGMDRNGCTQSASVTVSVVPSPIIGFMPNEDICEGQCVPLNASGGLYYLWSPCNSLSAYNIPNPIACPTVTTTYSVAVSNGSACPPATDSVTVIVHPLPALFLWAIPDSICIGDTSQLFAGGAGIGYLWSTGNNSFSIFVAPQTNTQYSVTTIDQFGCTNSDSITVYVFQNPCSIGIKELFSLIPNPFTNSFLLSIDKTNHQNLSFNIYDVLGDRVRTILIEKEQTIISRQNLADGMYFYRLSGNEEILYSGKLLLTH